MKRAFTLAWAFIVLVQLSAQSPEKMSFQAVIRNSAGELIKNDNVGIRISILRGSSSGSAVYTETQNVTTNQNGLITLEIGSGTPVSGSFGSISWSDDEYFLKTETDPEGGVNYTITGVSQFLSVPYAIHAKSAQMYSETDPEIGNNINGYSPKWDGSALVAGSLYQSESGRVGIGTSTPGAVLDISSTTSGVLIPRLTTEQRDQIASPVVGLQIFNTTTNCFNVWSGSTWGQICPDCGFLPVPGNNSPICAGLNLELSVVAIPGATYSWTGPGGFSSNLQNPVISSSTTAASGAYYVTSTVNGCTSKPVATVVTITPSLGPSSAAFSAPACVNNTLNLTAASIPGASYTWSGPNNFFSNIQNPSISNVQLSHAGTYHVVATMGSCSSSSSVDVIINPLPAKPGTITGNFSLLSPQTGVTYSISAVPGAASYTWSYSGTGATITGQGTNSITIDFACGATSGNLSVRANNVCGGSGEAQTQPVALSGLSQPSAITGNNTIILPKTAAVYSVTPVSGATEYVWTIPASLGTITAGQGTSSVTVDFTCGASSGLITVAAGNSCGTGPSRNLSVTIASLPTPGSITGPGTITFPQTGVAYSIPSVPGATTYTWTVPAGATIASGQGSNAIVVDYACGASSGNISVVAGNSCSSSGTNSLSVTITTSIPAMPGAISGTNNIPAGVTGMVYSITPVSGATSYLWTVPAGAEISTGQGTASISVNYLCSGTSGNISVIAVNDCGQSSPRSLAVTVNSSPSQPGAINGTGSVPKGSTGMIYSIPTVTGATSYTWSYTGTGATITSGQGTNSVTISFSCEATNGNLTVNASNTCSVPGNTRTLGITISGTIATPGTITGSVTPLTGQQSTPYSVAPVAGAETYTWSVPTGATIASGQGTNSILVNYGCSAAAGNISVTVSNSCIAAGAPRTLAITPGATIGQPGSITGVTSVPQGKTGVVYSIDDVPGATTYTWSYTGTGVTFSSGQGTKTVIADFSCTSTTGNISVTAANLCIGPGPARTIGVTVSPLSIPGAITGPASIPQGSTGINYSVAPVAGATSYTWLVPVGASIVHGQGTNSILVDYGCTVGNGNILVTADNACGSSGGSSLNITITSNKPATPGGISTNYGTTVSKGLKNIIYSIGAVPGASSYTWTVPAGAIIISGQGSTSIMVDHSCSAVAGNVSVVSNNTCGSSTASNLYINIIAAPTQPGGITGTASVPKGSSGFTYTISPVNGANIYNWTVPAGASITSGQGTTSIRVDYSCSAVSGNITVNAGNLCGNISSNSMLGITVTPTIGTLGSITGVTSPAFGQKGTVYSVTPVTGVTNYSWSVPGDAVISSGQGTSSIKVDFPCSATNGTILVSASNGCSGTTPVSLSFALSSAPLSQPGAITGPASVPRGTPGVVYSISPVTGATSYNWTVPANCTIISGQGTASITVDFSDCSAASGNVSVTAQNDCVSVSPAQNLAITVTSTALPAPGGITGLQTPIQGQKEVIYSISDVQGATSYTWSYSGTGLNIISGQGTTSIIAEYLCSATSGNINVTASNGCSATSPAQTLAITVGNSLGTTGAVSGSQAPRYGEMGLAYSTSPVPGATSYTWTVSPGVTIVSGQGTPAILVNFSCSAQSSGTIRVTAGNSCALQASQAALSYSIGGSLSAPGSISGLSSVPKGSTSLVYSVSAVNGATSYTWSVPSGFTIVSGQGTNTIKVDAGCSVLAGNITVKAANSCETTTESILAVTILSTLPAPGSISGTASPATGSGINYSIVTVPGASLYNWTAPSGATLVSGEGTNSVWYNFACGASAGNISVTVSNACISAGAASSLPVTPQVAASISTLGNITETVASGTNTRKYSVAPVGSALYSWAVPAGMTIISGQGTPEITATYSGTVNGNVSVTASNICLTQNSTSVLSVTASNGVNLLATGQGQYGSIQTWTVPAGVTTITIEARGAQGGSAPTIPGGLGAKMKGTFAVTPGQVLKILVGQMGTSSGYPGGGGGTFVTDSENNPLIIAGGGGTMNNHGVITQSGSGYGAGTDGAGGSVIGGGGMYGLGSDGCNGAGGGKSFISGGFGGNAGGNGVPGGFGGGSGSGRYSGWGSSCSANGSGGGYSGGGNSGGGGSFNTGSNQNNAPGVQSGDGMVLITW